MKVTVIDRICGDGKTLSTIKNIRDKYLSGCDDKYIFITPYLSECHRVAGTKSVEGDEYQRPEKEFGEVVYEDSETNLGVMQFKHPSFNNKEGSKAESLRYLMSSNQNIVSTHNLFLNVKLDTLDNAENYTLVVDEALDVFNVCSIIPRKETKKLLKLKILELEEDEITLKFDRDRFGDNVNLLDGEDAVKDTRYEEIASLCDNKQLLLVNGNVLLWELSSEILKKFKEVIILTYLFEGREMSVYLKKHGIPYQIKRGGKGGKDISHLVDVVEDERLNSIGDNYFALSATKTRPKKFEAVPPIRKDFSSEADYLNSLNKHNKTKEDSGKKTQSASEVNDQLRRNLQNVMHNLWKAKKGDRYFTCLSDNKSVIAGKNFKKDWLGFSTKATNEYSDAHHVAFLMNVFIQPYIKEVCDGTNFKVDEDLVALSHLVQFMFRSALRNGEEIKMYVPSSRMRDLLVDYLNGRYDY